jgi:hypothetical protein
LFPKQNPTNPTWAYIPIPASHQTIEEATRPPTGRTIFISTRRRTYNLHGTNACQPATTHSKPRTTPSLKTSDSQSRKKGDTDGKLKDNRPFGHTNPTPSPTLLDTNHIPVLEANPDDLSMDIDMPRKDEINKKKTSILHPREHKTPHHHHHYPALPNIKQIPTIGQKHIEQRLCSDMDTKIDAWYTNSTPNSPRTSDQV